MKQRRQYARWLLFEYSNQEEKITEPIKLKMMLCDFIWAKGGHGPCLPICSSAGALMAMPAVLNYY